MGSSQKPDAKSPANDVRALFDKTNLGNQRYRTFTSPPAPPAPPTAPAPKKEIVSAAAPAIASAAPTVVNHESRRALNSIFEVNTRLHIHQSRSRLIPGSGAALSFASCAGGVGKTTLCATVARVLSSRLANILVADRCSDSIIPYYFSLDRQGAGGLQTVYPNARRAGYQMTLVVAPGTDQPNAPTSVWLQQLQSESGLMLQDLPTFQGTAGHALDRASQVVVPLIPDVQSVASLTRMEEVSRGLDASQTQIGRTLFVLNRFDEGKPLHREIRAHLEKLLEDRLAPVAIRESDYVPEALSLGMTVIDYMPQAPITQEVEQFVAWIEEHLAGAAELPPQKMEIA